MHDVTLEENLGEISFFCKQNGLTPGNVDAKINDMIQAQMRTGMAL
jgi:hypothetical protein